MIYQENNRNNLMCLHLSKLFHKNSSERNEKPHEVTQRFAREEATVLHRLHGQKEIV